MFKGLKKIMFFEIDLYIILFLICICIGDKILVFFVYGLICFMLRCKNFIENILLNNELC